MDEEILSNILKEDDVVDWSASFIFAGKTIKKYLNKYIFLSTFLCFTLKESKSKNIWFVKKTIQVKAIQIKVYTVIFWHTVLYNLMAMQSFFLLLIDAPA